MREPWHSDNPGTKQVRYLVSYGNVGSTRALSGTASKAMLNIFGDLSETAIEENELREVTFDAGTALRFTVDFHAGPLGSGRRLLHKADIYVR